MFKLVTDPSKRMSAPLEGLSDAPLSSTQVLARIGVTYQVRIDWTGRISKTFSRIAYRTYAIKLSALILVGVVARIIKNYAYHPITVIGNTIYAQTIINTLASEHVDFAVCAPTHRISYYETTDGNEIAFEGYRPQAFDFEQIKPEPLSEIERIQLEQHTNLKIPARSNLGSSVLRSTPKRYGPVMAIKKFLGNLYYVTTGTQLWITRRVITDGVHPLYPGEIISSWIQESRSDPPSRSDVYRVESDLSIGPLGPDRIAESLIYSLKAPRPFRGNDIIILHPFHLPPSADPLASLIGVTLGLISTLP